MQNIVITYKFADQNSADNFEKRVSSVFPKHRISRTDSICYFAFPGSHLGEVEDRIHMILDKVDIADQDYVAMYSNRPEAPLQTRRLMIHGASRLIERDILTSGGAHERTITELLDSNFALKSVNRKA